MTIFSFTILNLRKKLQTNKVESFPVYSSGGFKVLVVTGTTPGNQYGSGNAEIIDLERPSAVCSQPSDLPANISGAVGGFFDGNTSFVCYGTVVIRFFKS